MKINFRVGQAANGRAFDAEKMANLLNNAGDIYKNIAAYFTGAS